MLCTAGSLENAYQQNLKYFAPVGGISMCELGAGYGEKGKKVRDKQMSLAQGKSRYICQPVEHNKVSLLLKLLLFWLSPSSLIHM